MVLDWDKMYIVEAKFGFWPMRYPIWKINGQDITKNRYPLYVVDIISLEQEQISTYVTKWTLTKWL